VKNISSFFETNLLSCKGRAFKRVKEETDENESIISKCSTISFVPKANDSYDKIRISELKEKEERYLEKLCEILEQFVNIEKNTSGFISMMIRNHTVSFAENIKEIIELHQLKVLRCLDRDDIDCGSVIEYLLTTLDNDDFYCYVNHAILFNTSYKWLDNFKLLINLVSFKSHVDVNHLDITDIIYSYKDWISNVMTELITQPRKNSDVIASALDVEKKFDDLLEIISDAEKVGCIKEVTNNNLKSLHKVYNFIEKGHTIVEPILVLFPRYDKIYGYRNPVSNSLFELIKILQIKFNFRLTCLNSGNLFGCIMRNQCYPNATKCTTIQISSSLSAA
jgi:hypothetical protein